MQKVIDIKDGVTRMPAWRMRQPVNFELLKGENLAIVGPNGGGKSMFVDISTILEAIATSSNTYRPPSVAGRQPQV